jgi:hypothetical protein
MPTTFPQNSRQTQQTQLLQYAQSPGTLVSGHIAATSSMKPFSIMSSQNIQALTPASNILAQLLFLLTTNVLVTL